MIPYIRMAMISQVLEMQSRLVARDLADRVSLRMPANMCGLPHGEMMEMFSNGVVPTAVRCY